MKKKLSLLIIDDEPDILQLLLEEFEYHGHSVEIASSGNEAVGILKNILFDVVISDYRMPNGDGMSVLNFVNLMNNRPEFYFVSGYSDLSPEECVKKGATKFFSKPLDLATLVFEIEKLSNAD